MNVAWPIRRRNHGLSVSFIPLTFKQIAAEGSELREQHAGGQKRRFNAIAPAASTLM